MLRYVLVCMRCLTRFSYETFKGAAMTLTAPQALPKKCGFLSFDHRTHRFLHEQRHQCRENGRHLLPAHNLITVSTDITTKRKKIRGTIPYVKNQTGLRKNTTP